MSVEPKLLEKLKEEIRDLCTNCNHPLIKHSERKFGGTEIRQGHPIAYQVYQAGVYYRICYYTDCECLLIKGDGDQSVEKEVPARIHYGNDPTILP